MPVLTRLIPSPIVVDIRAGALDDLATVLADQRISSSGRLAVAISGGSGAKLRERVLPALPQADWFEVGGGTLDDAIKLADAMKRGHYDAVVGLGGGKIIDCAKFAAARVGLPLVAVATNLSHDGLCSPVATLDNDAGRGSYGVPNPIAVVIDLDVIREAPVRFVRSGIGDALSNISAVADWELANRETGEAIDGLAAAMARQAGEAVLRHPGGVGDDGFLQVLAEGLVLTGISMSVAGDSRPASGACHEINHAFDLLFPRRAASHGEQCGLGAAFAMHLRGAKEESAFMAEVLHRHGLPVLPDEIGFTVDEFVQVVEFAPQTRPGRYTILEHLELSTEQIKDAYADYAKAISS
ncbi:iron-containing alcohol dehydrogenase family protein [Streptomyces caniscabiei]|uniref:Iron-containing alcohol dehydrogenase family protein n=1 Tax=Streptomyces caniscabiei TaxID=2746961 RepID=A0A927KY59_9ACTN|nr:iron-containing alcohol dehydrogenase family protein [Streptomyces caniscabiei]MBD9722245.1 iron-containing alcohol dehydrogenase family protein [Streptomyces caniscabiei]MDX3509442.1 iron-containing alcohol dehydrogenase family protein [Streptomyces caniscabiei]MDX3716805.1 iron-containing alcohol dehydrogenase family protein [Streptomyces caniscabiei]MDX3728426.1 iron-containing alcohol dehydrogenase family protein [Streptomyces caniscabiei]WEO22682.1 iron-containing alcohol dehydrogenase